MSVSKDTTERRLRAFESTCKQSGLRLTPQRMEVYRELARASDHPSAEMVHKRVRKRLSMITLDTVYRTLNWLEGHGLVVNLGVVDSCARYEAELEPHGHFLCSQCRQLYDIYADCIRNLEVQKELPAGYTVTSAKIELHGICAACNQRPVDN